MKRTVSLFLFCLLMVTAFAQTTNYMLQARKNFMQGNYAAAREYARLAQAQGSEEAATLLGQIDYKTLVEQVEAGTATTATFLFFKTKYKGTEFETMGNRLYEEWKGNTAETVQHVESGRQEPQMHFDRKAYELAHFGPMYRIGASADIGFGGNATYGGGLSVLVGRTNHPVNLLVGMEFNVLSQFNIGYDEYTDTYTRYDDPYLRARRLTIPIELQVNMTHNDRRQRSYFGLGIDYNRNFYGRLIDTQYGNIDYTEVMRKHTCDFRMSLGYSFRHVDVYAYMKVFFKHPFDNDLVWWEDNGPDQDLDTYSDQIYDQLHHRCSGGFGIRLWL